MRNVVRALGPLLFALTLALQPPGDLTDVAWHVAGLAAWMALWWLTVAVPLEATALLPIVVLPLTGALTVGEVTASYADPVIFLFLGGFLIAATLERWELHRRFAIATVRRIGTTQSRVILAFMLVSAFASMWVSNTATAVMMLPIAMAVVGGKDEAQAGKATETPDELRSTAPRKRQTVARAFATDWPSLDDSDQLTVGEKAGQPVESQPRRGFPRALMLAIAYGCSIGGVATLVGTPPNAILAAAARELVGVEISFAGWLTIGLPVTIPMLVICWLWLTRLFETRGEVPGLAARLAQESGSQGRLTPPERFVLWVFVLTAVSWVMRAPKNIGPVRIPGLTDLLPGISDAGIAIAAAVVLFAVPLRRARFPTALDWDTARRIPWGILLLFGGGLALANAFESSGLTSWLGGRIQALEGASLPMIFLATATLFVLLTELTSNTATAALAMPLMAGVALGVGSDAFPLMVTAALAASMAFMLPVATPPNAIVFGSGAVSARDMRRAGLGLNVAAIGVITLVVWLWV